MKLSHEEKIQELLKRAKAVLPDLRKLLAEISDHWGYEDPIYRFYHHSFKVYDVQNRTKKIAAELRALAPFKQLNSDFERIVSEGTGKTFDLSHNQEWLNHTRPMIEAFFHAKHALEMLCKYAEELDEPPQCLSSGWATVLSLYDLR